MVAQSSTNGHSNEPQPIPAIVEYTEAVEAQLRTDAALARFTFTGIAQDLVMGDFVVWAAGAIVGWAKTLDGAAHRAAQAAYVQPAAVGTIGDVLPLRAMELHGSQVIDDGRGA